VIWRIWYFFDYGSVTRLIGLVQFFFLPFQFGQLLLASPLFWTYTSIIVWNNQIVSTVPSSVHSTPIKVANTAIRRREKKKSCSRKLFPKYILCSVKKSVFWKIFYTLWKVYSDMYFMYSINFVLEILFHKSYLVLENVFYNLSHIMKKNLKQIIQKTLWKKKSICNL